MQTHSTCTADGCSRPVYVKKRGLCQLHYQRWWKQDHGFDQAAYNKAWRERNRARVDAYNVARRAPVKHCIDCGVEILARRKRCELHAHQAQEQRDRATVVVPCSRCGTDTTKLLASVRKYKTVFCSMECRNASLSDYRNEQTRQRRLPVGPVTRTAIHVVQVDNGKPAKRRTLYAGRCAWCDDPFVSVSSSARYCSDRHSHAAHKRSVHPELALQVYERDDWTCMICLEPVKRDAHYNDPLAPTCDHILPKHIERIDELHNLRTAHRRCNELRGTARDELQLVLPA